MNILSIIEIAAGFAVLFSLASTRLFVLADGPPQGGAPRVSPLDGLRGVLAFLVVFHHADLFRNFAGAGWASSDRVLDHAGPVGVSMFFMITGYLFFGKMIAEGGRPRWGRLYVGRLFRIAPVYYLALVGILIYATVMSGFRLHVPARQLAEEIGGWMLLGAAPSHIPINGLALAYLAVAGATWSLRFEWSFYALLPVVALLGRISRRRLPTVLAALLALALIASRLTPERIFPPSVACAAALFLVGMLCAAIRRSPYRIPAVPQLAATLATVACLAILLRVNQIYTAGGVVFLAVPFFLVTQGATMSGLLVSRAARRIGDVSYPAYLLHGFVLVTIIRVPALERIFTGSTAGFLLLSLAAAALVLVLATLAHVAVEQPGIEAGRRIVTFVQQRRVASRGCTSSA